MDNRYVNKKELGPYKDYFSRLMESIRPYLRNKGITFHYNLVGSAKRNLVIPHPNKGFDCDYQIFIEKNKSNLSEKKIKYLFITLLNDKVDHNQFSFCKNRTTAITIKKINENESRVEFSYDIVIMKVEKGNTYVIRENDEQKHTYHWAELPDMRDYIKRYNLIKGNDMWTELRNEYYKLKMNNKNGEKSYHLLNKAINNVLVKFKVL